MAFAPTKTQTSRRTLRLPDIAGAALEEEHSLQGADQYMADGLWEDYGLVFCMALGAPLECSSKVAARRSRTLSRCAALWFCIF